MLEVRNLSVAYGPVRVLNGIDLQVGDGEIVALIGPNGAGKTTTLNAIAGLLPREGEVLLDGEPLAPVAEEVVRRGVALVPQGRRIFPTMTVEENLFMGAYARGGTWRDAARRFAPVYEVFPRLAERRRQAARSLSGGEQQMLVIGRALLSEPRVMLVDELSLGLAPKMVLTLLDTIRRLHHERGTACLLVEQAATAALSIAGSAYLLRKGEVVFRGSAEQLRSEVDVLHGAYLGTTSTPMQPALRR
ncbi:MAG TPA: ABC transporter ATP-binding protein [Candidatus Dormibacteraeota bacterium]|nr:ABC transporter ATP-binding protein [Candidatus Dormibacteraeota bacterium]